MGRTLGAPAVLYSQNSNFFLGVTISATSPSKAKNSSSSSTMFKRIEKRLKRREEEEKLGIDDETRDILGLNDTDSDESQSDSDLSVDVFDGENESEGSEDENEGDGVWGGIQNDEMEAEEEEGSRQITFPTLTAQQALDDPIYAHPTQDNAHLCSICPGKTLISAQSTSQHLVSKAHERRSKHLADLASHPEHADSSLSDLMRLMEGRPRPGFQPQGEEGTYASKRAEKKRKAVEIRKAKREKRKAREKEKRKVQDADTKTKPESSSRPIEKEVGAVTKSKEQPKRKKGVEKERATDETPAKKKRKTDETEGVPSEREIAQKIKEIAKSVGTKMAEDSHIARASAKKKRKAGETGVPSEQKKFTKSVGTTDKDSPSVQKKNGGGHQVTQTIKDIAKSATKRARVAQSKANNASAKDGDNSGGSKPGKEKTKVGRGVPKS